FHSPSPYNSDEVGPLMTGLVVLIAALGFALGAVLSLLFSRAKAAAIEERNRVLEQELVSARADGQRQTTEIRQLSEARSALQATLEGERRSTEEKLLLLQDTAEQLKSQFQGLAASALESNNANFLQLARSVLQNQHTQNVGDLAQKEQAVRNLVEPI